MGIKLDDLQLRLLQRLNVAENLTAPIVGTSEYRAAINCPLFKVVSWNGKQGRIKKIGE